MRSSTPSLSHREVPDPSNASAAPDSLLDAASWVDGSPSDELAHATVTLTMAIKSEGSEALAHVSTMIPGAVASIKATVVPVAPTACDP